VYTRTGRPFFQDRTFEDAFLARVRAAMDEAEFWSALETDWVCLDAEILPWSAKAEELLRGQYAAVGSAGTAALERAVELMRSGLARSGIASSKASGSDGERGASVAELAAKLSERQEMMRQYVQAYRRYCWKVDSLEDLKLAPFHLLATEGRVHTDRDHAWHLETLGKIADASGGFVRRTSSRIVDLTDPESERAAIAWWEEFTGGGGEGMVVKPSEWIVRGKKGLIQPALKCRGREYLRIIYGPEYTAPEHLERLRARGLAGKRSLALREFALGLEALHRFVEREPLYRVHECVFGVLALESVPVDPRL
jgi:protein phosphatase